MKLLKIIPSGYCKGVVRAINIAKTTALNNPDKQIYILGMIVHNSYVTQALNQYNIITLSDTFKTKYELLDEIDNGIVIFTAHGISDDVVKYAKNKGLKTIDATCFDVLVTKNNIIKKLKEEYKVLYIGKKNHPEADAIISISDDIHLITKIEDINSLNLQSNKIYVTNQTTMSIFEITDIFARIKKTYPFAIIEEEICSATRNRQQAVIDNKDLDLLYVVGDIKSNNSNKLRDIAILEGIKKVYLISSVKDLNLDQLNGAITIGVTAGASTPTYLTNQVCTTIQNYIDNKILILPEIKIKDIL
jgi:4-hydroxy-3-methylbut-2-enyl diphosphate reductase